MTGLSGKPYEFYKQIDIIDLHKYLKEKYHEHTGNCLVRIITRMHKDN